MKKNTKTAKRTFWAVVIFYFLVAFEFFYMASPFAVYFYSVYKPGLLFLDKFPQISWLTGFFLPHLVESTQSTFINSVSLTGGILAFLGAIVFLITAFQIYYAKIYKKGAVNTGFYKYIRHPQYTAFAVCSFGLMLLWPRYLVLIMYITLLFAYYLLAKAEEKECSKKFGKPYDEYLKRTHRFVPINIPKFPRLNQLLNSKRKKAVFAVFSYVFLVAGSIYIARELKEYSISSLYSTSSPNAINVSIIPKSDNEINDIYNLVMTELTVKEEVTAKLKEQKMINYLLPSDLYISEIPMERPLKETSHVYGGSYDNSKLKFIFTTAVFPKNSEINSEYELLLKALRVEPFLEVWIDLSNNKIIKYLPLHGTQRYKNIPEPTF